MNSTLLARKDVKEQILEAFDQFDINQEDYFILANAYGSEYKLLEALGRAYKNPNVVQHMHIIIEEFENLEESWY